MKKILTNINKLASHVKASWIDTPLGLMVAISDAEALLLLEFADNYSFKADAAIGFGVTEPLKSIKVELAAYFAGKLTQFNTPLRLLGTNFQKLVWQELRQIPYGQTRSYLEQATAIGKPTACRAVANANHANLITIVIPCHRIIHNSGKIGGYRGGLERKRWLIEHEKSEMQSVFGKPENC